MTRGSDVKPPEEDFVEDLGQQMVSWGLSRTTGRVYGLLLLRGDLIGLEDIAQTLGVARSGASVAARQLVALGLARAAGERGTRRVRYEALYTLESLFAARTAQIHALLERLRNGATVATAPHARRQLRVMAGDLETWMVAATEMTQRTATTARSRR